jgi:plasmid stability protein
MPSIQVKNVPDDVHAVLRERAAKARMSLQDYLLKHLTEQARQPTLEEIFERIGERTGGSLSLKDATEIIRSERASH